MAKQTQTETKSKKLSKEELEKIHSMRQKYSQITNDLGNIEISKLNLKRQKEDLEDEIIQLRYQEQEFAKKIDKKYGKGTINLETGDFSQSIE